MTEFSCLYSCTTNPYEKESILKGKNLLPRSKLFPLRIDPFKKRDEIKFDGAVVLEAVSILLKCGKGKKLCS